MFGKHDLRGSYGGHEANELLMVMHEYCPEERRSGYRATKQPRSRTTAMCQLLKLGGPMIIYDNRAGIFVISGSIFVLYTLSVP